MLASLLRILTFILTFLIELLFLPSETLILLVFCEDGAGEGNRTLAQGSPSHLCKWLRLAYIKSLQRIVFEANSEDRPHKTHPICHTLSHWADFDAQHVSCAAA
jgi:hypothetical protein